MFYYADLSNDIVQTPKYQYLVNIRLLTSDMEQLQESIVLSNSMQQTKLRFVARGEEALTCMK